MERISAQNVNAISRGVSSAGNSSSNKFGIPFAFREFPQIPRWVGVVAVAATAFGVGGWYYYFYKRHRSQPKGDIPVMKKTDSDSQIDEVVVDKSDLKALGNEYFKKKDFAKALEFYTKGIESAGQTPEQLSVLYQNRAAVFEKLGDKLQVINECTLALKIQPNYIKALSRRAKAYKDTGFLDEALEDVTTVCLLQQFQHAPDLQMADNLLKDIGQREAKKIFKTKQPSEPSHHSILSFLRSFHEDPVSKEWAQGTSNGEINDDSNNSDDDIKTGYQLALYQLRNNKFSDIIQLCDEEINFKGSQYLSETYLLRGTFKFLWGYSTGVLDDYKVVINDFNASNLMKASAWLKTGIFLNHWQWETTADEYWKEAFETASKLTPTNVDIYHHWGQQLLLKGEIEGAIEKINKAVECSDTFPLAHATLIFLNYRLGLMTDDHMKIGKALIDFDTLEKKWPNCSDIFNFYGQILMEMQRFEEALKIFDHVIKIDPTNTNVMVHKALCKAQQLGGLETDFKGCIKDLRDSLKIDRKNGYLWETLGSLETQARNQAGAAEAMNNALALAKTFHEIAMVASMKAGAEMQFKVKAKLNVV